MNIMPYLCKTEYVMNFIITVKIPEASYEACFMQLFRYLN